jgi:hypothetical protein
MRTGDTLRSTTEPSMTFLAVPSPIAVRLPSGAAPVVAGTGLQRRVLRVNRPRGLAPPRR